MLLMPNQSTEQLSAQLKQGKLMFVRLFLHYDPRTRQQEYAYEERIQGAVASAYDSRAMSEKAKLILDITIAEVNAANPQSTFVEERLGKSK